MRAAKEPSQGHPWSRSVAPDERERTSDRGGCCNAAADGAATGTGFDRNGSQRRSRSRHGAGVETVSATTGSSEGIGTAGIPTTGTWTAAGFIDVVAGTCSIGGAATSAAGAIGAGTAGGVAGAAWAGAAVAAGISLVIDAF